MLYIILVQGFCPLRIEITQFHGGFRVKHKHRRLRLAQEKGLLLRHQLLPTSSLAKCFKRQFVWICKLRMSIKLSFMHEINFFH